uniref:Ig-like domain repeat protein n=1 Tax=Klebsiella quasipneumoniae TaxID=1463165 RepID=UPI002072FA28
LMMSLWDALRMNMMISYQELVRTFPSGIAKIRLVIKRSNGSVVSDNNLSYDTANKALLQS